MRDPIFSKVLRTFPWMILNFCAMHSRIEKQDTHMRIAISAEERLAITLKFLATGDSYGTLSELFRISRPSIVEIVPEVCQAIFDALKEDYLQTPTTPETWSDIAEQFQVQWNYPNCIGALDGKHVLCKAPPNSGSSYYNYKGTYSIVLMALVDANYRFLYVNIGAKGSASDGGIFFVCAFNNAMENNALNLPTDRVLPGRALPVPFCIVADDAFAASTRLMKPVATRNLSMIDRVYNYRLSRARRVSENAFGLAAMRWRALRTTMEHKPENIIKIVSAICVLHNFFMRWKKSLYAPKGSVDVDADGIVQPGEWRNTGSMMELQQLSQRTPNNIAAIRDEYKSYFVSQVGELSWQYTTH